MQNQIQNYKILSQIGSGGMGSVYLGEDEMLDRKVAIKVLNPQLTADTQFRDRFKLEAKLQASLLHTNIVGLYSFFEDQGSYCMVMEYAEGETLKQLIERTGPIPEDRALSIFRQMLEAVGYAHNKGIVHRDIKPSNIIVSSSDAVKIMDFGIAKLLGDKGMTKTGTKMGTLYYMSPEQIKAAKDIDARTDIYSLGMTLYEMLAGTLPFEVSDDLSEFEVMEAIVHKEFPSPTHFYPHISKQTVELVRMSLEKKRDDRIGSTADMISMMGGVLPTPARSERQKSAPVRVPQIDNLGITWISVEGGEATLYKEEGTFFTKQVPYRIKIESFQISATPITFEQYDRSCDETGAKKPKDYGWGRGKRPVINVNVADSVTFCKWLGKKTGKTVRLPEEKEWEYAARGGNKSRGYEYSGSNNVGEVAWYDGNSGGKTHEVGTKKPNELGIYDMSGNVWEWCGTDGAIRGGSSFGYGTACRVQVCQDRNPDYRNAYAGFRIVQEQR